MELFVEQTTEKILSEYEIERGKPMPNLIHGAIQANLSFELKSNYRNIYRIASEVTLDTLPQGSTPDLVILANQKLDFSTEIPARHKEPPFATIEIQSPSQSLDEMVDKANIYFDFGVKSCWIVQPRIKAIIVFFGRNQYFFYHEDETLKDPNLNIKINLKRIFE